MNDSKFEYFFVSFDATPEDEPLFCDETRINVVLMSEYN